MPLTHGTYIFTNKAHVNSKLDLLGSAVLAPVIGLNTASPQQWKVTSTGGGKITIQNVSNASPYASADRESENTGLVGSSNSYNWVAADVAGEDNTYVIKTTSAKLVWTLTSGSDYAVVVLKTAGAEIPQAAKWVVTEA